MDRKYELLEVGDGELFRIRALRDFGDVKAGDMGGLVESDMQLSHDGNCWIYDGAVVHQDAKVYGDARVHRYARVYGNARIYGYARVHGEAKVYGTAEVYGVAEVYGYARVYGEAKVYGDAEVHGDAEVYGAAEVHGNAKVYGEANVHEHAEVYGYATVNGHARVKGLARVNQDIIINCEEVGEKANTGLPMEKIDFDFSILPDNVQSIKIDGKSYEKRSTWVEV
jgi:predicted acyltransferase (DUF342 family)